MSGRVYLIGAGCGGPELLTLRAAELLRRCDCVVYDDLIDSSILDLAPPEAERIYMGKRSGRHSAAQSVICSVLIEKAREGKCVVRLKGGDPFVFGRGGEELLALHEAGVPCSVVPGISSAIAIPELAGIPVTHRGLSRSFHVVTAHSASGALPENLDSLAAAGGTLVFLMGLSSLPELCLSLIEAGMRPETPTAVISGGNSPHPADVRGTLADIAELASGVESPAVIVVGETAALRLSAGAGLPLSGLSVGLTGTAAIQDRLRPLFQEAGARVFSAARSRVLYLDARPPEGFGDGGWIVLTSANGVEAFFRLLLREGFDLRRLHGSRFAVIGPATGEALRARGVLPDLVPETHTGAGLAAALLDAADPGESVFLFRSALATPELPQALAGRFDVTDTALYTVETRTLTCGELDYLVFSSAQGARSYFGAGGTALGAVCVSIGPVTGAALRELGAAPILQASDISAHGVFEAVLRHRQSVFGL